MATEEGIIQFAYNLQPAGGAVVDDALLGELNAWRIIFKQLGLVGQVEGRYGSLGFGNLSARDPERDTEFVITASQTGALEDLSQQHLVRITHVNLERFWVDACGDQPPSSETLTHAMIYAADPRIRWVFHCHSPALWQMAELLALPATPADVPYGSPDMVNAVAGLLDRYHSRPLVFTTLGHTDGVFACGGTARDAGGLMVTYLAKALAGSAES